ncbi:Activated RNA polymerase II transcriptional coactivator [Mycena indigotica]|uniref:Activated RNA polymerase II transcriptional coactivator n=1 Tax=Mycena indigotica TaxID=2126181 RepID=A0A8H6TE62_9AGAR|nr:Activated RNA polymerase II transcriptional coactivator [Mycena indigotica]KAF7315634.1 Activated RNA polymerase II transcriptional coactivator [Mycena indigotica]
MPPKRKSTDGQDIKPAKKSKKVAIEDESESEEAPRPPPSTVKKPKFAGKDPDPVEDSPKLQINESKEKFVDLGKNKRVTIREFKKSVLVDIREFYTDKSTDEMKPGKKGISLSLEQYQALKSAIVAGVLDEAVDELK